MYASPLLGRHVALVAVAAPDIGPGERVVVREGRNVTGQARVLLRRKNSS
jgi:hypothetical protein